MKRIIPTIATISILSLLPVPVVIAQSGTGGCPSRATSSSGMYDPKTVETITGQVISIDNTASPRGMSGGLHLKVKTLKEEIPVHLGPVWYINQQNIQIKLQDQIEVKGSRITFAGQPTIIAAQIKKDNQILNLRSDDGLPVWAGWRRNQR
ncbi:DNA-binding protein [Calothrix membranacea FACHB-236]|nr:DNA-binding protein [Calothrix membranacea FACHB-236]